MAQGVQYDPAAQFAGLPTARSAGDPARSNVDQAARIAGARDAHEACGGTNLTCGSVRGGRSARQERIMRNKMILVVIFLILSPGSLVTQETESNSDLEIAKALIVTDPSGDDRDDLRVLIYVKNTGRKTITVLTRNLQHEIFLYEDRPKELHITLSTTPTINGSSVILSLPFLAPVELHPGEVAEIEHFYTDTKDLKEVIIVYDMMNIWSKRFNTWQDRIRSEKVEIMKFEKTK